MVFCINRAITLPPIDDTNAYVERAPNCRSKHTILRLESKIKEHWINKQQAHNQRGETIYISLEIEKGARNRNEYIANAIEQKIRLRDCFHHSILHQHECNTHIITVENPLHFSNPPQYNGMIMFLYRRVNRFRKEPEQMSPNQHVCTWPDQLFCLCLDSHSLCTHEFILPLGLLLFLSLLFLRCLFSPSEMSTIFLNHIFMCVNFPIRSNFVQA